MVAAVAQVDPARAEALRTEFVPPPGEPEPRGEEALQREGERASRLLEAVADLGTPGSRPEWPRCGRSSPGRATGW